MKPIVKKILYLSILIVTLSLFIVATSIFLINRENITYYSIDYSIYKNVSNFDNFEESISDQLGTDLDNMFIKNVGEIKTDTNGGIISFNIDCSMNKEDKCYDFQIKFSDKNSYKIICEKSEKTNTSNITLKEVLTTISYYKFDSNIDIDNYNFIISNELINNINVNVSANKQYLLADNNLVVIDNNVNGAFSKITVLLNDTFEEIYYQIK